MLRAAVLLAAALIVAPGVPAGEGRVPVPAVVKAKGDACVEPVEVMRREHMHLLHAHRDETVRLGDRDERHSLSGCVECHAVGAPAGGHAPVNAPGQFCAECHAYAGVSIDCFQCHSTVPAGASVRPGQPPAAPMLDRLSRALFGPGGGEARR